LLEKMENAHSCLGDCRETVCLSTLFWPPPKISGLLSASRLKKGAMADSRAVFAEIFSG